MSNIFSVFTFLELFLISTSMESEQDENGTFPQDQELEDLNEDELEEQENNVTGGGSGKTTTRKRKQRELTSPAWAYFTKVMITEGDPPVSKQKAQCNMCGTSIAADPNINGTSGMNKHLLSCKPKHEKKDKDGQTKLIFKVGDGEGSSCVLSSWKFSQKEARLALCEMIILDELPFKFVEKEGFRKFLAHVCPDFKIPSRHTIREDCVKLFVEQKKMLMTFFKKKGMGRVSITTDCWTAINNTNFICVTAHFIGVDWTLHKKIIGFRKIIGHKGDDIGTAIVDVMNDWEFKSILCCVVDNASANDGAVRHVGKSLDLWNTNVLGGKYLHVRCAVHIMNLVVSDGLEEIGVSVRRVRETVKWIRSSPMRSHEFYRCASNFVEPNQKRLCSDVSTRWNSTYLMLETAEPYEVAIRVYGSFNLGFVNDLSSKTYDDISLGPPKEEDWVNVRKMLNYLKYFYDFTLLFSGTTYVTAHLFFKEMCGIFEMISELEMDIDDEISSMAKKMKVKIGKYWLESDDLNPKMNKMLYIAAVLDPRQKLDHVEACLVNVYGDVRAATLLAYVKDAMYEIFDFYKKQLHSSTPGALVGTSPSQSQPSSINTQQRQILQPRARPRGNSRIIPKRTQSSADDFSELTIYYSEPQHTEETNGNDDAFDILNWWAKDGMRYRVLSEMAKDILAIPVSTVASESAFSMGGRVLDQFRSSLNADMVEALICSSDWLRSSPAFMLDEEEVSEEEQQKEFDEVMKALGFGGETLQAESATGGGGNKTSMITPVE